MDRAAKNGHIDVLKWLHENRHEGCSHLAIVYAAERGHLDVAKWLHASNHIEWVWACAMEGAAVNGRLEVVKWLYETYNCSFTERMMRTTTYHGHLEVVNFLQERYINRGSMYVPRIR
jgi:hypothetical protein